MPTPTSTVASFFDAADFAGPRYARPLIDALTAADAPPRVLVSGNAGSGKTTVLRSAQRFLAESGMPLALLNPETDVTEVPSSSILLVDDLHLVPAEQLEGLSIRASDPGAALVATSRPWPLTDELSSIARHLERSRPAVVLGHLTRADVLDHLAAQGRTLSPLCLDTILQMTDGVSWLVSVALAAHDDRDCEADDSHAALTRVLEQNVAHRLDVLDDDVRRMIETICVVTSHDGPLPAALLDDPERAAAQGYAEGLLLRGGRPVPIVQAAVRAGLPIGRLVDLFSSFPGGVDPFADAGATVLAGVHHPQLTTALLERADQLLESDPQRARQLYTAASQAGATSADATAKRAQAAWACGDIDAATQLIDDAIAHADRSDAVNARIADVAAASWSMRGMLETGCSFYDAFAPTDAEASVRALIARMGVGHAAATTATETVDSAAPSTLGVSMKLLRRGLLATLGEGRMEAALADLVRASHLYTSSQSSAPMPEHPAIIAAIVALSSGDLASARSVLDAAVDGHTGTPWVLSRLLLWRSWVALQQARGPQAREALESALALTPKPAPRDDLLVQAIRIGLARRYEDATALAQAWNAARAGLLDADVDLYTLLPLVEFVSAGARVGDSRTTDQLLTNALGIVERLGSPALWSAHLRWAGIQEGILTNHPDALSPHAHALVETAPTSHVAATMARAGRLWTSVLAGSVDADEVESAAHALAGIGLQWDAARLAGQGAGRASDRKVSARLLARAREIHPPENVRTSDAPVETTGPIRTGSVAGLSERETDVARLVVQGKTYAEIGETIFISPRTAEHHIASIRRRLGATSRSDLIAKLRVALTQSGTSEEGS
ncbi:LuxR C-terminal-related transcriptional regulator [Microbacterium sp. HD4P20]|uniref:LuxR family transcriptional regulator n=1 Tax=Microbacterium sp. HD4P20 TaxID=2864874 RepID=UPI001C63E0CB|nr:LuxR family transcriptional regulator [Microbacterium sp. HD4P20]MCP2635291.1 LuxR C-terminal-related transcriptional regulator [Microbacterium sp. HD4P20]